MEFYYAPKKILYGGLILFNKNQIEQCAGCKHMFNKNEQKKIILECL